MPAGLQVWDHNQKLTFDTTTQAGRIVGSVEAAAQTGSININLPTGIPFAVPVVTGSGEFDIFELPNQLRVPQISINGTSLTWERAPDADDAPPATCIIYYGVY